jgi:ATP-dependent DNA helicase DinG
MGLSYISKFPSQFNPNDTQLLLINSIERAFEEGYKFVVCSAPTGSGKSFISKTLGEVSSLPESNFIDAVESYEIFKRTQYGGYQYENTENQQEPFGCFALTITKALQDQYQALFDDISILKGKSNYQCTYDNNFGVDTAPCMYLSGLKESCWSKNSCLYYNARNKTITSKFAALNYDMFFALPSHIKQKEFIVCDEASELEDQLVKMFTCPINFNTLKKLGVEIPILPSSSNYTSFGRWVQTISAEIDDRVAELKSNITNTKKTLSGLQLTIRSNELSTLQGIHNKIKTLTNTWSDSEYIIERHDSGVTFTPLKVDKLSKYIFESGKKIILMSATIIDPENFCKTLGITNYKYIEAESTFDSKKAPIYISTKYKLNFSNLKSTLPKIAKQVDEICNIHKNDKGIIHTHTNFITETLQKHISNKRILYREAGTTNEDLLKIHQASNTPTILASPSMSYGVDLKGDLARFQIIVKAPYLPTADKRIERLMKSDSNWYINKMLASFIQSCGRGVRSKGDFCTTYVLDGAITDVILKNKHKIPKYFLDRFV